MFRGAIVAEVPSAMQPGGERARPNPRGSAAARLVFALWFTVAAWGCTCSNKVKVEGSTCAAPEDCLVHPSCGLRVGGCSCERGACYFDPSAPIDESGGAGCRSCHGSLVNPAPPGSLDGGQDTGDLAVGSHQSHLNGGAFSRPVSCAECHLVPKAVGDPGHLDSELPAEVTFGPLARTGGVEATWDRSAARCSTYCHGESLDGGSNPTPKWTAVDGTQAACGTCHGLPPGGTHPQSAACERCHDLTAGPNLTIINRFTHVDGVVQVKGGSCDTCHGDPTRPPPLNASPPRDLNSNSSSPKVGAHLQHLVAAGSVDVACSSCHVVPTEYSSPGHVDDADRTAEVTFSGAALAPPPAVSAYDPAAMRCSNTYCHGATLKGGTNLGQAGWTNGPAEARCNACHGNPPPAPHPASDRCESCHDGYSKTGATTGTTNKALHVDGVVEALPLACTSCHGDSSRVSAQGADPNQHAAPPIGTTGSTLSTDLAVGAHLAHVNPGPNAVTNPLACADCHPVPTTTGHSDGTVQVAFGPLAQSQGSMPT